MQKVYTSGPRELINNYQFWSHEKTVLPHEPLELLDLTCRIQGLGCRKMKKLKRRWKQLLRASIGCRDWKRSWKLLYRWA